MPTGYIFIEIEQEVSSMNSGKDSNIKFSAKYWTNISGLRYDCSTIKFNKNRTSGLGTDLTMYQLTKLAISSQKIVKSLKI